MGPLTPPRDHNGGQRMKRALSFGLTVAKTYLGFLLCIVCAFPVIFVGGFLALLAYVLDHAGLTQPLDVGLSI